MSHDNGNYRSNNGSNTVICVNQLVRVEYRQETTIAFFLALKVTRHARCLAHGEYSFGLNRTDWQGSVEISLLPGAAFCAAAKPRFCGLPGGDRTPDPQLRRLLLYPTELRAEIERKKDMVGAKGFEPSTLWSQTRCATRLRYAPTVIIVTGRKADFWPTGIFLADYANEFQ